jgi:hypothetical protein
MQVWIVCFLMFFGAAELYQWLQGVTLPMPVFVITGALLAVASNVNKVLAKQNRFPAVRSISTEAASVPSVPSSDRSPTSQSTFPPPTVAPPRHYPGVQLPQLTPSLDRSISFTIKKSVPMSEEQNLGE